MERDRLLPSLSEIQNKQTNKKKHLTEHRHQHRVQHPQVLARRFTGNPAVVLKAAPANNF